MRHRSSTELTEYLTRQQKVREEIVSIAQRACMLWETDASPEREQEYLLLAERAITVVRAICNIRPMVIEETSDDPRT